MLPAPRQPPSRPLRQRPVCPLPTTIALALVVSSVPRPGDAQSAHRPGRGQSPGRPGKATRSRSTASVRCLRQRPAARRVAPHRGRPPDLPLASLKPRRRYSPKVSSRRGIPPREVARIADSGRQTDGAGVLVPARRSSGSGMLGSAHVAPFSGPHDVSREDPGTERKVPLGLYPCTHWQSTPTCARLLAAMCLNERTGK